MTFFGHEGTKTGIQKFAFVIFSLTLNLISLDAHGWGSAHSTAGSETAATTNVEMADAMTSSPPGVTTPATSGPTVPGARTAMYAGNVVVRGVRNKFRIRPDLSIENIRYYTTTIVPRFENGNSSSLPDGWYLLRIVLTLPKEEFPWKTDVQRFVSRSDVLGYYTRQTGSFMVTFGMKFPDMTRGWIRDNIYIEIKAVDQSTVSVVNGRVNAADTGRLTFLPLQMLQIVPQGRFVPFSPANEVVPEIPLATDSDSIGDDLDDYIKRVEADPDRVDPDANGVMDEATYTDTQHANLRMVDPNSQELVDSFNWYKWQLPVVPGPYNKSALLDLLKLSPKYVQEMPDQLDPTLARAFCAEAARLQYMHPEQLKPWVTDCTNDPYAFLNMHKNIHVRSHATTFFSKVRTGRAFPAQIISNFSFNRSQSTDAYFSMGMNASVLPLSAYGETFKATPLQVGFSVGHGSSTSTVTSGISQTYKTFKVFQYIATIPMEHYRACVAIEINKNRFYGRGKLKTRGLYICDEDKMTDKGHPFNFDEGYYVGTEDTLGDLDFAPQAANVVLRGDREINHFLKLADDEVTPAQLEPARVGEAFSNSVERYSSMPGAFPGIIVLPMVPRADIKPELHPPNTGGFLSAIQNWFVDHTRN